MGSSFVAMSNLKSKSNISGLDKFTDHNINVDNIIKRQRGNDMEMKRHGNSLSLLHIEHGKTLGRMETKLVEKLDRATRATNF